MYSSNTAGIAVQRERSTARQWGITLLWSALWVGVIFFLLPSLAFAGGGGGGGAGAAQARITAVAQGWQGIVTAVGVAVLIIAWSYVGYQIAFSGKTMKDMFPTMVGTTIAGMAPILVGWLFA